MQPNIASDLKKFFNPSSVALVGATEDLSKFGGRCMMQMLEFGYQGRVYPINPKYKTLRGLACYPSVSELPETPDHVGIVVASKLVPATLRECVQRGVKYATIFTSNFSEIGTSNGHALQDEIKTIAREGGIRFMGPNCNGLINFVDRFAMVSTKAIGGPPKTSGNVGLVCHSGGLGQMNVMWRAQEAGVGITYEISCGNEADLDTADFLRFMLEDTQTDAVMMAIEGIRDGAKFTAVARQAAEAGKPIIMLKFGRTEAGRAAAASHTGALTGSDEIYDAAFRQLGVIRVDDCNELYEVVKTMRRRKWPAGRRAAALSGSGGHSVLMADVGAGLGIEWSKYSETTISRLRGMLPGYANISNPTDLTSALTGSASLFQDALQAVVDDEHVDFMIPVFVNPTVAAIDEVKKLAATASKPVAVLWTGSCPQDPQITAATLVAQGLPVYRDATMCLKAVRAAMAYGEFQTRLKDAATKSVRPQNIDASAAAALLKAGDATLTERASKEILAAYGIAVTQEHLARSAEDAQQIATRFNAAVALKVESPDIAHKTEAGAIRLNISGADAIRKAYDDVIAAAKKYNPAARINGVLIQEMVPAGVEVMLGIVRDPVFGPVVVAALGGIYVEVLRDAAYRLAPVAHDDALAMLRELRAYPLLEGVRGSAPRDVAAIADAIVRLSWLAHDLGNDIKELDINPVIALEASRGIKAVDALIVKG